MRYEYINCDGECVKAWPLLQKDGSRRWECERCGQSLRVVETHEPLHPIAAPECERPPEEAALRETDEKEFVMQDLTEPVGQTQLQEHVMAMKLVLENAARELPEFQWLAFASITSKAIKVQRAPQ